MFALIDTSRPASAQNSPSLEPVIVAPPTPRGSTVRRADEGRGPAKRTRRTARPVAPKPALLPGPAPLDAAAPTPLNGNLTAGSASLLGLPIHEMPASVEIVRQQQMQEQGYRTTTETAQGAVGVLSGDAAGAPAGFAMRGFTFGEVTTLYNGIWIGPQSITSRVMDTAGLDQVEFLKGPSSIMSGLAAIGGSVNYVSRQPTTGPIRNELDGSIDTLGTYRTHFGSGGSTTLPGLDYRFDVSSSKINSFIDDDYQKLNNVSGALNYRVNESFKVFGAVEYRRDDGRAYWGTPLTTTTFSGPFSTHGVVAGTATNTFDGSTIGPVTVDSRTLKTNYNVADDSTGAHELWLRGGFEWAVNDSLTVRNQAYEYGAKRHWFDSETYAFNTATSMIDRDRFFVTHKQRVIGDNTDVVWNTSFFGMENRLATQLSVSRNEIQFQQEGNPDTYPADSVEVINPAPGLYGIPQPNIRNSRLDDAAISVEDRLKITPMLALIGGIRVEDLTLSRDGMNFDGSIPAGQPFTKTWNPVSYRAAVTLEPVKGLLLYGMYATAYDPAAAGIFSVTPGTTLELTSARIYETGLKIITDDKRAEVTFAAYDIQRNNVYVALTNAVSTLAGQVHTQGVELAAAARPIDNVKLWGNVAVTQSRYDDFDVWTGNTPSNIAPVIINAGASYRFNEWRWPVEFGGSIRHVGQRFLADDNLTAMLAYTTGDLFAFIDIPGRDLWWQGLDSMRVRFRVRNVTNAVYAAWSDPGYPDQVYLGAPRTFELSASAKW
ncbi:TonB-dependent receptor [Bradyrhizobium tropiciagri]|uniref:TonB-dependent receptor n=1 Tax=Bradyrhizobium tropiciagri TaxID=312253 RepID=UPI002013BBAD|nr:TonB-dependent receptor [Bradyrhizobium tropiciagri]